MGSFFNGQEFQENLISLCREGIATIRYVISQKSADLREVTTYILYLEVLQET